MNKDVLRRESQRRRLLQKGEAPQVPPASAAPAVPAPTPAPADTTKKK
jgi:hypothetical protein